MTLTPTNLIIIAFVCVTIGYIAGVLISNFRLSKQDHEEAAVPVDNPALADNLTEIARLVREIPGGPIQVEFNEKQYRSASEMNRRDRDALEEATVELLSWLGFTSNQSHSAAKGSQRESEPGASSSPVDSMEPLELAGQPAKAAEKPVAASQTAAPPPPPPAKKASKSIVNQINDILSEKTENTPYETRHIRLVESVNGVIVQVGAECYPDINAVPDQEIRSLIRASAAEWEKRSSQ
ncbi:MAG TPA: hypothetical protein VMT46_13045 [Anaerolineaceae bacterium]|nr:hypothetical protein [Anaerolineaceae bacterium]